MSVDRSWMERRIRVDGRGLTLEFRKGVDEFLEFAEKVAEGGKIRCPCKRCMNSNWKQMDDVKCDLFARGFMSSYTSWTSHGESLIGGQGGNNEDTIDENIYDCTRMVFDAAGPDFHWDTNQTDLNDEQEEPNEGATGFYKLLEECEVSLYPGHDKYTVLSAVTKLLHFKNDHDCSERGFNALLTLIKEFLPDGDKLPLSYYEVKRLVRRLNLGYNKIDACKNDCMLYYGENNKKTECDICGTKRYKDIIGRKGKYVPNKILRYFPLAPRLQRLFMSAHTAEHMRWHKTREVVPGQLTHPSDGDEWLNFDKNHPTFAEEIRNVRLGLSTDGFNPFNGPCKPYSCWPVIMVVYNLPPSMCMKDPYMFLTLLIPGDKSPSKDINVYLRPLVDELKMLWDTGVRTYDASLKNNFNMKAALLWTINDFPALGMVSGWSTHGSLSYPVCLGSIKGTQLKHGWKTSFFGTSRQFLPISHGYRKMTVKFNRRSERRQARGRLSGSEVFSQISRLQFPPPGKMYQKDKAGGYGRNHHWTHLCMFFELPYWATLSIRHCLDVMHTEKNIFDNVFYTVLDSGRTKDNSKSRMDLKEMGLREELWLKPDGKKPKALYTLTKEQVQLVCQWVSGLKLPDGYSSNISRCSKVDLLKFQGLKSHDCHVFMQRLIPIVFHDLLPQQVVNALIELSNFFRDLCSTVLKRIDLDKMEHDIVVTMCKLEMIFPPAFFDSMEHLPLHMPYEAKFGGPVQYRWMYPFERLMRRLKQKVKNRARVEGSISERYVMEELVNFCSLYFESDVETRLNRVGRNEVPPNEERDLLSVFTYPSHPFGGETLRCLTNTEYMAASLYILLNTPEVSSYIKKFEDEIYASNPMITDGELQDLTNKNFPKWFKETVKADSTSDVRLKAIADGPGRYANCYKSCVVNGYRFTCGDLSKPTSTNSGVLVKGTCYNDLSANYYGRLTEVVVLRYWGDLKVVTFKCKWFDIIRGVKVDHHGCVTVDVKSKLNPDEPFVLASQVCQVYYAANVRTPESKWYVVVTTKARGFDNTTPCVDVDALQEDATDTRLKRNVEEDQLQICNDNEESEHLDNESEDQSDEIDDEEEEDPDEDDENEEELDVDDQDGDSDTDGFEDLD